MSRPLTWQNVSAPDFSQAGKMLDSAFESFDRGLGGYRERLMQNATEGRLSEAHKQQMRVGEENIASKQFENAHADERLEASLASSRAYTKVTGLQTGKAERMLADREKARELIFKTPKNEDGSHNRNFLTNAAMELDIHPDALQLEMASSSDNSGFTTKLAQDALLSKRAHEIRVKNAGSAKGGGATKNMDENPVLRRAFTDGGGTPEMEAFVATKIADGHDPIKVRAAAKSGITGSSLVWGGDEWSYDTSETSLENLEKPKVKAAVDALNTGR